MSISPGVKVQHATIQRSDPQIGFVPGKGRHVERIERRMEDRDPLSVIDQHATLLGPNQEMPGSSRQDCGDGAGVGVGWQDLAEGAPVEGKQPSAGGRDDQFWLPRVGKNRRRQGDQWRSGKLAADRILVKQRATWRRIPAARQGRQ